MPASTNEIQLYLYLLIGFVAFSMPLLIHDTKQLWGGTPEPPMMPPAPPPPYYGGYNEPDDDSTKFRHAVGEGDIELAEQLLNASLASDDPVDFVTTSHWHGSTALFEAARSGHLDMAKWLVSRGADPNHSNEWGDSPANEAASMGHWDLVWFLADEGADLTKKVEHAHSTLVLSAVRHRSVEALAELKRRGVDLSQRQWNGATAIHEAARTGESAMIDWLIQSSGIDINATNDQGEGAVHEASMMGHLEVLWKLIRAGADLGAPGSAQATSILHSAVTHSAVEVLDLLMSRGVVADLNADKYGRTPLIEAVRTGNTATVDWLLRAGANVSMEGSNGETAVVTAAMEGKFDVLWKLVEAGASVFNTNEYGGSLLMSAVHHGDSEHVTKLLDMGLNINHANHRGDTALTLAASRDDVALLEMLIKRGATATPQGSRMDTPLIRAARFRRLPSVQALLLMKPPIPVDAQNARKDTALIEACRVGALEVATELLKAGASVSHANNQGMTPLLEAAEHGNVDLCKLLIETHNADVTAVSKHGDGVIELSKWGRQADELEAYFTAKGAIHHHEEPPHVPEDV